MGIETASALPAVDGAAELAKGAIIGAMLIGAAFLAGVAVMRKSSAAFCGLLLLSAACALQAVWLGIVPVPAPAISLLLEGAFAASALIFLSATIGMVGKNQLMGGVLFAGALSLIGIGIINAVFGGEAAGLQRAAITIVAAIALGLSAFAGAKGDIGARLVLPGAALAAAAPMLFGVTGASGAYSLAPQAVFAIGVLLASLVALADFSPQSGSTPGFAAGAQFAVGDSAFQRGAHSRAAALRASENQLAEVLDYAGLAVWDWNRSGSHQTPSFAALMGADCDGAFTPEAFREFVHRDDAERIETRVFDAAQSDGGFDESFRLLSGRKVRMRGARAVDHAGALERIVAFVEEAGAAPASQKPDALKLAAASLTATAAAPSKFPVLAPAEAPIDDIAAAIGRGEIVAAFQPIISFDDGRVRGAEALVRWPAAGPSMTTEQIVRKVQLAGKGRALSSIMLTAAARHAAERIAAGDGAYFAAFNVSLTQVREEGFLDDVKTAIGDYRLPKGALVLELTEGERLTETPKVIETFKKLKAAGVALAYDDFGAGFSSLSNLHKYDFDYLKIDKSFIDDIVANGGKKKIVGALVRLGRDFGMTVIAEGVESKEAAEMAKAIGCRMGQGYYLGEPTLASSFDAAPDLATIEVVKSAGGEIVLDRSMKASRGSPVRRRRFARG